MDSTVNIDITLQGKSSKFYKLSTNSIKMTVKIEDDAPSVPKIAGFNQAVATVATLSVQCSKAGQYYWHIVKDQTANRSLRNVRAMILDDGFIEEDDLEQAGFGFISANNERADIEISQLHAL